MAHFDVLKRYMIILKMYFPVNQFYVFTEQQWKVVMDLPSSVIWYFFRLSKTFLILTHLYKKLTLMIMALVPKSPVLIGLKHLVCSGAQNAWFLKHTWNFKPSLKVILPLTWAKKCGWWLWLGQKKKKSYLQLHFAV